MSKITFSVDTGVEPTIKQRLEISKLSQSFFHNNSDPEQMHVDFKTVKWYKENFPEGMSIIFDGRKIAGFTFIFLSDTKTMNKFCNKKINEEELSQYFMKQHGIGNLDCVYLCAAFVKPEYRGNGYAMLSIIHQIKHLRRVKKLFFWGYSEEGAKVANKIAKRLKLSLYSRI